MQSHSHQIHRTRAETAFVAISTLAFGAMASAALYVAWIVM